MKTLSVQASQDVLVAVTMVHCLRRFLLANTLHPSTRHGPHHTARRRCGIESLEHALRFSRVVCMMILPQPALNIHLLYQMLLYKYFGDESVMRDRFDSIQRYVDYLPTPTSCSACRAPTNEKTHPPEHPEMPWYVRHSMLRVTQLFWIGRPHESFRQYNSLTRLWWC